jgi:hypothetical protein
MPDLMPFAGPLGAAAIALVSAVTVFVLTQRHQLHQDVLKDARTLRDAKRARLRDTCEIVLHSADAMRRAAGRLSFLLSEETEESRDAELRNLFAVATEGLDRAGIRLLLDPEGAPVYAAFEEVRDAWIRFQILQGERRAGDRSVLSKDIGAERRRLEEGFTLLLQAVRSSLSPLDEPIRELPPVPRLRLLHPRWQFWRLLSRR